MENPRQRCQGLSLCVPATPRRRANAASRRACNLDPSRAYIANTYSGLRIYHDDSAGVRCFFHPLGHRRGRAVSLREGLRRYMEFTVN
jgi:hypothetical protein